jgi:hypothetical protein
LSAAFEYEGLLLGLGPKCLERGFERRFLPNVVVCVVMFC